MPSTEEAAAAAATILVAEFAALRAEIQDRSRNELNMVTLNITASAGVWGLALSGHVATGIVLVLCLLCPSLGRIYADNGMWSQRIGEYIDQNLRPIAVVLSAEPHLLEWEAWWRDLEGRVPEQPWKALKVDSTIFGFFTVAPAVAFAVGTIWLTHHHAPWWWLVLAVTGGINVVLSAIETVPPVAHDLTQLLS